MTRKNRIIVFLSIVVLFTSFLYALIKYLKEYFYVSFEMLIVMFFANTTGTGSDVYIQAAKYIIPRMFLFMFIFFAFLYIIDPDNQTIISNICYKKNNKKITLNITNLLLAYVFIMMILIQIKSLNDLGLFSYIKKINDKTYIYENEYVSPDDVSISAKKKKNLIYIYLESMEVGFASKENGGLLDYDLIPNLRELAAENTYFSFNEDVGGFHSFTRTSWTVSALLGSESGIPYAFPVGSNSMRNDISFAPKIITLGDILEENGYNQEFLCGSDSDFGGRRGFFKTHGNFRIFDYYDGLNNGYTDDYVWWGLDDRTLYEIAKDELAKLYKEGKPFNLTMLTVDTHHIGGYVCDLCNDEFDIQYANVVKCADKQIGDFINWLKEQPYYEDTLIVISGDHPTMDGTLITEPDYQNRFTYECFINSSVSSTNTKNREFNTLDMFPTILAAMGFEIEGDKLGLGTNLFSGKQTLEEKYGYSYLNSELNKYSDFYAQSFYAE